MRYLIIILSIVLFSCENEAQEDLLIQKTDNRNFYLVGLLNKPIYNFPDSIFRDKYRRTKYNNMHLLSESLKDSTKDNEILGWANDSPFSYLRKLQNGKWRLAITKEKLRNLEMNDRLSNGWAVTRKNKMLHFDGNEWNEVDITSNRFFEDKFFHSFYINKDSTYGYCLLKNEYESQFYLFIDKNWDVFYSFDCEIGFYISDNLQSKVYFVGRDSLSNLHDHEITFFNSQKYKDLRFNVGGEFTRNFGLKSFTSHNPFHDVIDTIDFNNLRLISSSAYPFQVVHNSVLYNFGLDFFRSNIFLEEVDIKSNHLKSFTISSGNHVDLVKFKIVSIDTLFSLSLSDNEVNTEQINNGIRVNFNNESIFKNLGDREYTLVMQVTESHKLSLEPITNTYEFIQKIKKPEKEKDWVQTITEKGLYSAGGALILCCLLITGSIPSPTIRRYLINRNHFNPIFFLGNTIIIKWIIFLVSVVKPLKQKIFNGYRKNILERYPRLTKWENARYISPNITYNNNVKSLGGLIDEINKNETGELYLLLGQSGLGKTVLFENLVRVSLNKGITSLFVSLGGDSSLENQLTYAINQYGDLELDEQCALEVVSKGKFFIFLDGFNEVTDVRPTKEFIQKVLKDNIVFLSSQFNPGWENHFNQQFITLSPFGEEQLGEMLGEENQEWLNIILNSNLKDFIKLPQSAELIVNHIKENGALPKSYINVYSQLGSQEFRNDPHFDNVGIKAQELFAQNERSFSSGERLPKELCDNGVSSGVFLRYKNLYRFRHERIFRYFVASSISKREIEFVEFNELVNQRMVLSYWDDVIEILCEMKAESFINVEIASSVLIEYFQSAGMFNKKVFKERIYKIYRRLVDEGKLQEDEKFLKWSVDLLANIS